MSLVDSLDGKSWKRRAINLVIGALVFSTVYLVAISRITRYLKEHPEAPGSIWLAAAPIAVLMLVLVVAMRSLRGMDELERKMHTEAMAFAFLASLFIISTCGFLALAGFMTLSLGWIAPTMAMSWVIGLAILARRYR